MKICFKTITGKKYEIELDPSQSILDVKSILQNDYKISGTISLLYQSKILDDSQTIKSINLTENSFIVIYTRKLPPKKNTTDSAKENQSIIENKVDKNDGSSNLSDHEINTQTKEEQSETSDALKYIHSTPIKNFFDNIQHNDPPDFHEKVEQLKVLGYGEYDCEEALRAAFYQLDVASDYLCSGNIPKFSPLNLEETLASLQNNEEEDEEDNQTVEYIKDLLNFKQMLQENPELFPEYVSRLEGPNPEFVKPIKRDPALFLYQLGLDPTKFDIDSVKTPTSKYEELMRQFNSEEKNAIHRLELNGFDVMTVIQVYIACDKNEELTTSCLDSMKS